MQADELAAALVDAIRNGKSRASSMLGNESPSRMFCEGRIVANLLESVGEMLKEIKSLTDEIAALEAHWYSLPWDEKELGPDFRHSKTCVCDRPDPSGPGPDFDPALLTAKTVRDIQILNDVRDVAPAGAEKAQFALGGDPVVWLSSEDGTRVAVPKKELGRLVSILAGVLGNIDNMKPSENADSQ